MENKIKNTSGAYADLPRNGESGEKKMGMEYRRQREEVSLSILQCTYAKFSCYTCASYALNEQKSKTGVVESPLYQE